MFKLIGASLVLAFIFALASSNYMDAPPQGKAAMFASSDGAAGTVVRN